MAEHKIIRHKGGYPNGASGGYGKLLCSNGQLPEYRPKLNIIEHRACFGWDGVNCKECLAKKGQGKLNSES